MYFVCSRFEKLIRACVVMFNIDFNMFADDTQLINKTEESIEETFKTLEIYEKASGAKMNLEKTVGCI